MPYCDECMTEAYDEVGENPEDQKQFLDACSYMMADHLCDRIETNGEIKCACEAHIQKAR